MKQQVMPRPSVEQAGLLLWNFVFENLSCINELWQIWILYYLSLSYPISRKCTLDHCCWFHHILLFCSIVLSSFNIASSCCILFVVINVSWTCVSSSFSLCSERLDRHLVRSFSQFDVSLLGVSSKIWYWCTLDRSMNICRPLLVSTFQQFE